MWIEPDEPAHPLAGLVFALERAQSARGGRGLRHAHVDAGPLARLATHDGHAAARLDHPFPGRYEPSALPVLRAALAREAPARRRWRRWGRRSWARRASC